MKKKKVGVIGCGFISYAHIRGWQENGLEVVALCDLNAERLEARAQEFGIKKTYSDYVEMIDKEEIDIIDMPDHLLSPILHVVADRKGMIIEGEKTTSSKLIYLDSGDKRIEYPQKAPIISFEDIPKEYLNCKLVYICTMDYEVPLDVIKKLRELNIPLAIDLGGYGGAHGQIHPSDKE
ncbi:unnamed protein product, partial [marine sediment metagenome]